MADRIIALVVIGVAVGPISLMVRGFITIYMAKLGIKHPAHQRYFLGLIESKMSSISEAVLKQFVHTGERNKDDKIN